MHKIVHNVETGEIIEVPLTAEEVADFEARQAAAIKLKEQKDKEAQEAANAKAALLEKLGITEDEAKLLLG